MYSGYVLKLNGVNFPSLFAYFRKKNISIKNLKKNNNREIIFSISVSDYKILKSYLYKFYKVEIIDYLGVKKINNKIKSNLGLLVGGIFAIFMIIFSNSLIWNIEIYGLESTDDSDVLFCLLENNIGEGKWLTTKIDEIELMLLSSIDTIADVSIQRIGSSLIINISEKLTYQNSITEPIYATYDGIIKSISVTSGTSIVSVGEFVREGDILVAPYITSSIGEAIYVVPVAVIGFEAHIVASITEYYEQSQLIYTGNTCTEKSFYISDILIMKKKYTKEFEFYDKIVYNEFISKNSGLPIIMQTTLFREYTIDTCYVTFDDIKDDMLKDSQSLASSIVENNEIISESSDIIDYGDYAIANTYIVANMLIM